MKILVENEEIPPILIDHKRCKSFIEKEKIIESFLDPMLKQKCTLEMFQQII